MHKKEIRNALHGKRIAVELNEFMKLRARGNVPKPEIYDIEAVTLSKSNHGMINIYAGGKVFRVKPGRDLWPFCFGKTKCDVCFTALSAEILQ